MSKKQTFLLYFSYLFLPFFGIPGGIVLGICIGNYLSFGVFGL